MGTGKRKPLLFLTARERILMGIATSLLLASFLGFVVAFGVGPIDAVMRGVLCVMAACFVAFAGYFFEHRRSRCRLIDCEFRLCMYCGYDLRATSLPGACPECGETIDTFDTRRHWELRYPEWKESGG